MSTDANGCPVCAGSPGGNPGDIGNYLQDDENCPYLHLPLTLTEINIFRRMNKIETNTIGKVPKEQQH